MNYINLKAEEFIKVFLETSNAEIIDVRTAKEFKSGHIDGARHIPSIDKDSLLNLDKSKSYFIHCRVGGRSAMVSYLLSSNGFKNIYNLNDNLEEVLRIWQHSDKASNF